jgi:hypothetical protein
MKSFLRSGLIFGAAGLLGGSLGCSAAPDASAIGEADNAVLAVTQFTNPFGAGGVVSRTGTIDRNNQFFQNLGTNGRTCNSCHKLEASMGITTAQINAIFNQTNGLDPIFRINDGSNAPTGFYAKTGTVTDRRISFSMLLAHGDIRVGIGLPATRDYSLAAITDPYGFANANELSLFRRPMPSINMAYSTQVMWDGRESEAGRTAVRDALINQANDATTGHAQRATPLDTGTRSAIADFQLNLFGAQETARVDSTRTTSTHVPGSPATDEDAFGGPNGLLDSLTVSRTAGEQGTFPALGSGTTPNTVRRGINDSISGSTLKRLCNESDDGSVDENVLTANCFKNISLTPYEPWESAELGPSTDPTVIRRGEIGDGENLFYNRKFNITGVAGLNDVTGKATISGTCTTCHTTPQAGTNSSARMFNTGVADASGANPLFTSDFPIYTFRRNSDGAQVSFTDPGLALRTGRFADLGKFKVPSLRGLGARAPYFHNGSANTLDAVVDFYNRRFNMNLTSTERRLIILFLQQT